MRDALHLTKFVNFGEAMPRPRRRSKPVFGGPLAAKNSLRCPHTHPTTGDTHVSRMYVWSLAWQLRQKPLAVRRGLLVILPAETVRVSTTGHTSREPVFAAREEGMLVQ
jgi:hypothetical protein